MSEQKNEKIFDVGNVRCLLTREINTPYLKTLLSNIKIISTLERGKKLVLKEGILSVDNSIFQSITRCINKQSRELIVPFVTSVILNGLANKHFKDINDNLLVCPEGLYNMIYTYPNKTNDLQTLIDKIRANVGHFGVDIYQI